MLITRPLKESRWSTLAAFVDRWYRDPLAWPRGPRVERVDNEIARVEDRMGHVLPQSFREWFALVGHRLPDEGGATRLEALRVLEGRISAWSAVGSSASVELELAGEEPRAVLEASGGAPSRVTTTAAMLAVLASGTVRAVASGRSMGPVGTLAEGVTGGFAEQAGVEVDALRPLEIGGVEGERLLGHDALVVLTQPESSGWAWMAATPEARAEAAALFSLQQ